MNVQLFPNSRRPGVGLKPRRENQRPLLPQHSRHCPVLEAGSAAGFLVYPPLKPHEAFHVGYLGDGRYRFVYYVSPGAGKWEGIFSVTFVLPVGGVGASREEVAFLVPGASESRENAVLMARMFMATEDLGTPAGAVTLRGAWSFRTAPGWDTVYTPVFNHVERPMAPMLVVRVETDWYAHDTEFRYVLQPGEGISGSHSLPIGQVLFVPREEITLRECSDEELEAIHHSREEFFREKAAITRNTPYGLPYSPHYFRTSRAQRASEGTSEDGGSELVAITAEAASAPGGAARPSRIVGRNEPCPCGSGRKYRKCHGKAA